LFEVVHDSARTRIELDRLASDNFECAAKGDVLASASGFLARSPKFTSQCGVEVTRGLERGRVYERSICL
jgi:hypothetical protein